MAGLWRLAAAAAGQLPPGASVPEAELHGGARAWALEQLVRGLWQGQPRTLPQGEPLGEAEVFRLEAWTSVQWADPVAGDAAGFAGR